jgi:beta-glucosidase
MGKEMRIFGGNLFGGICVNLARHPGWGRSQESYGEDPLLLGAFGAALTLGARENGMVCVKHYALNSMEDARFDVDVQVKEGTMHECYLPHFKRCLEEGGAESLMSSYNLVNGEYMGQNKEMLDGVVRKIWGKEETFIVSDFVFGLRDGIKSVQAGLDVEYPTRSMRHMKVKKALHHKKIDWTSIERSGIRLIAAQLRFYSRLQSPEPGIEEAGCEAHRELSRQAATEGMILLKNVTTPAFPNEPILPLSATKCHRLMIIGELADSRQTGDFGSSAIKRDPEMITPLAGLRARKNTHIVYSDGKDLPSALELARSADVVFCMLGYTGLEEGECLTPADPKIMGHCIPGLYGFGARYFGGIGKLVVSGGGDRRSLSLPEKQEKLLKALSEAVGDRLILGIESGGPVLIPSTIREKCAAILLTGYGGCRFGTALRQVLFNEYNAEPSGRLPFTIAENTKDYPELDFDSKKVIYDRYWGYRFLAKHDRKPAYPFGFGLGYGKLELVDLKCDKALDARFFSVKFTVRNVGQLLTSAVVQVYGRKLSGRTQEDYDQVLLGFNKTLVKVGEEPVIQIDCRWDSLARWDIGTKKFVLPGAIYELYAGTYLGDERSLRHEVEVTETIEW